MVLALSTGLDLPGCGLGIRYNLPEERQWRALGTFPRRGYSGN